MARMADNLLIGGIEAGGTTFKCAVATDPLTRIAEVSIDTRAPAETMASIQSFFSQYPSLAHVGIASFGPLDLQTGTIADTPKLAWQNYPLLDNVKQLLNAPASLHTDVTAAALAEHEYGTNQAANTLVYITVGTGVGAAFIKDGQPLPSDRHAEMGHTLVPRVAHDSFEGICPFHQDCLEGLASAPAIARRWGIKLEEIGADHPAWLMEADYLAYFANNLIRTLAPDIILFGGGVMNAPGLLEQIQDKTQEILAGYQDTGTNIEAASLEPDSGIIGALQLAYKNVDFV